LYAAVIFLKIDYVIYIYKHTKSIFMKPIILKLITLGLLGLFLNSCAPVGRGSNAGYYGMDPAMAEANRRNTHRIEKEGNDIDNVERMRAARAIETATRNNPTHVTRNSLF
jgi:hypothetical protein